MSVFFMRIPEKYARNTVKNRPIYNSLIPKTKFLPNFTQILIKFLPYFTIVKFNRFLIGISKN